MLTVTEIADDLKVKPDTVANYLRAGRIRGTRALGGNWRVMEEDYEDFKRNLFRRPEDIEDDPYKFTPRDERSAAASKGAMSRKAS